MRVAIVGGSGFVGGHVADALMKQSHDVVLMDKIPPRWHSTAMYTPLDVLDRTACLQAFQGVQVVMHLAAMSNTQMAVNDPWLCTQLNCVGTVNVLDGARNAGVERVVVAGSSLISAYQRGVWNEEHEEWQVNEASPVDPLGSHHPYVTSKVFEEMIARDYMRQYDLPVTVMRYGIQYGPRMTPGVVVHSFIERALRGENLIVHGTGEQWRQYIHVADVAAAHMQVLERWEETEGLTLHIVTDRKVSILDLAHAVQKAVPGIGLEHGPERKGDIEVQWCDSTLTRSALNWEPRIELEEGVEHTVEWYRRHLSSGMKRR